MALLQNMLQGNASYKMANVSRVAQPSRLADANLGSSLSFNPTQREANQSRTAMQVQNYAASKQVSGKGRTGMRGNVAGYSDTLG